MKRLKKDIKEKNFKNIYLFYGDEEYLKRIYIDKLKKELVSNETEMMNYDFFEGNTVNVREIIDSAETMPFMSDYRLILIKNSGLFALGRKEDTALLSDYVNDMPKNTVIVFNEEKIDKRNSFYKIADKKGMCVDFKLPSENELVEFLVKRAKNRKIIVSNSSCIYFLRCILDNMDTIVSEIDKLIDYCQEKGEIKNNDIDAVCTKSLESKIFYLTEQIGNRNLLNALYAYENLILNKEQPLMILSMIARQFRYILQLKELSQKGFNADMAASALGIRRFQAVEFLKQSSSFEYNTLVNALKDCLECDVKIKTGKLSDKSGVKSLIIKYTQKL